MNGYDVFIGRGAVE
ncbi:hypothetical protein YPPY90_3081, partial [Yersinia pestis PY-90]